MGLDDATEVQREPLTRCRGKPRLQLNERKKTVVIETITLIRGERRAWRQHCQQHQHEPGNHADHLLHEGTAETGC